ncbi:MAG: hypothetical protein AAB540_02070, partial [Patescibacteria group bacterium]
MSYGGAGDSLEGGKNRERGVDCGAKGAKGGSGEKLWIDKFEGECWNAVNELTTEYREGDDGANLDEVKLSEQSTLRYCLDQLEICKAMAVDMGVPVEVAKAKV